MSQRILSLKALIVTFLSMGTILVFLNSAYAQENNFTALLSGDQEVPPNNSAAKGWAWFGPSNNSILYRINVTGLDNVIGAHIHNGIVGEIGDPIVTLFHTETPTRTVNGTLIEGNLTSNELAPVLGFIGKMERGETYVNIHTTPFPTGEIRGQIKVNVSD